MGNCQLLGQAEDVDNSGPESSLNAVVNAVADGTDVHRVVLPYRAWDLAGLIGVEHAYQLLRQSVHFCIREEQPHFTSRNATLRALLPTLLDRYHLHDSPVKTRTADEKWIDQLSQTIFGGTPTQAAEAVAAALSEGYPTDVGSSRVDLQACKLEYSIVSPK